MVDPRLRGIPYRMDRIEEMLLTKLHRVLASMVAGLLISCAGIWAGKPPPCPPLTEPAVDDVEEMVTDNTHEALLLWVSEVDRYCDGIKAMREN